MWKSSGKQVQIWLMRCGKQRYFRKKDGKIEEKQNRPHKTVLMHRNVKGNEKFSKMKATAANK